VFVLRFVNNPLSTGTWIQDEGVDPPAEPYEQPEFRRTD